MVQQVKAVKTSESYKYGTLWFRCNLCGDMFSHIIHFEKYDFYACIPRNCPSCGHEFVNGMERLHEATRLSQGSRLDMGGDDKG